MNGEPHICPECKSIRIGRQILDKCIEYFCLDCKHEWKEYFTKTHNTPRTEV